MSTRPTLDLTTLPSGESLLAQSYRTIRATPYLKELGEVVNYYAGGLDPNGGVSFSDALSGLLETAEGEIWGMLEVDESDDRGVDSVAEDFAKELQTAADRLRAWIAQPVSKRRLLRMRRAPTYLERLKALKALKVEGGVQS